MGATDKNNGASAIQSHMTNSRLTDPEVLEWRYPVILKEFKIRENSGGKGNFNGGEDLDKIIHYTELEIKRLDDQEIKAKYKKKYSLL